MHAFSGVMPSCNAIHSPSIYMSYNRVIQAVSLHRYLAQQGRASGVKLALG